MTLSNKELGKMMKSNAHSIVQLRLTVAYDRWTNIMTELDKMDKTNENIMQMMHRVIGSMQGYRYAHVAYANERALHLVLLEEYK